MCARKTCINYRHGLIILFYSRGNDALLVKRNILRRSKYKLWVYSLRLRDTEELCHYQYQQMVTCQVISTLLLGPNRYRRLFFLRSKTLSPIPYTTPLWPGDHAQDKRLLMSFLREKSLLVKSRVNTDSLTLDRFADERPATCRE